LIDLEMQSTVPDGIHARFVYYWAKAFAGSLKAGDDYSSLRPMISILPTLSVWRPLRGGLSLNSGPAS